MSAYLDFELEIGQGDGREYPVAVVRSPAGETRSVLRWPYGDLELDNRLLTLQNALLRSGGQHRAVMTPDEEGVRQFGGDLFSLLFAGDVHSLYFASQQEADRRGMGLRLKLRISAPELAALPWEFLYDPRSGDYLCLSRNTPVVRYIALPRAISPLGIEPPLRILAMVASPKNLQPLNVVVERQRVERGLAQVIGRGTVELSWLEGQTWRDLQRALRQGPWHIFHFVGHGGFDRYSGEGLVMLADDQENAFPLVATQLARLLADHNSLRLAVFNSCEGARGDNRDLFSSTAAVLVRAGIPAVLAMQYEITDAAAMEMSASFYEALVDGLPVDEAVSEARKAISLAATNTLEWGTPVLYTRMADGVIFDIRAAESRQVSAPPIAPEVSIPRAVSPASAEAATPTSKPLGVTITVAPSRQFEIQLQPERLKAGESGQLVVKNQGNGEETFVLGWDDRANELLFKPEHAELVVPAGQQGVAAYTGRPRRRWIGGVKAHPFVVQVTPMQGAPQTVHGEIVSNGAIRAWLPPLVLALLAALLFAAWDFLSEPPEIVSVSFKPEAPLMGQPVTVYWVVNRADTVELSPFGIVRNAADGMYTFSEGLPGNQFPTLVAHNRFGYVEKPTSISVTNPPSAAVLAPVIEKWSVTPTQVTEGESVAIDWRVKNAESVTIEPIGMVDSSGHLAHMPSHTQIYTLIAINQDETVRRSQEVVVVAPQSGVPIVNEFSAEPAEFERGAVDTVMLRWKTEGADAVTIEPGLGAVGLVGSRSVPAPELDTEYTLVARGPDGDTTSHTYVSVAPPRDAVPPNVSIDYSPSMPTTNDLVTFVADASDDRSGVASIEIWVNDQLQDRCVRVTSCESVGGPYAGGDLRFAAVAIDQAQNASETPVQTLHIVPEQQIPSVAGSVRYLGEPLPLYSPKEPSFWMRDEATGEEAPFSHIYDLVFAQNQGVSIRLAHGRQN